MRKTFGRALAAVLTALMTAVCLTGAFAEDRPAKFVSGVETPVLIQKNNPLCWAYAGSDLLSISAIYSGQSPSGQSVFSATLMARAEFDGNEHRSPHGNPWYRCYGGLDYALFAGISGKGLAPAELYGSVDSADGAPVSALYGNYAYIDRFVQCDVSSLQRRDRTEKIKELISENGAVACDLFVGDYNSVTGVAAIQPYDNSKPAHQVLLVGWDDAKYTDTGTGAFLMKNTWGENWGNGGYAWISYNAEFGRKVFSASVRLDAEARVLTHTETNFLSGNHTSDSTLFGAVNVFAVKEEMTLTHAGICSMQQDADLEARVFVNLDDPLGVISEMPDATASGSFSDCGFYTLPLDKETEVMPGDTVTVLYLARAGGNYYVFSEYSDPDFDMAVTSSEPGQSYTLVGGELKQPAGNYIGTVVGRVSAAQTVTETQDSRPADPEPVTETRNSGPENPETGEAQSLVVPFVPPESGDETGTGPLASAVSKIVKFIMISALALIALVAAVIVAAVASSKKKK